MRRLFCGVVVGVLVISCKRQEASPPSRTAGPPLGETPTAQMSPTNVVPYDTAGEAAASTADITPAVIAEGKRIFLGHGPGASSCAVCHGENGEGTKAGPRLVKADWIDADGSYGSIIRVVINGVPHPRAYPNPMPAYGGAAAMSFDQVKAVAAYVYSLNKKL